MKKLSILILSAVLFLGFANQAFAQNCVIGKNMTIAPNKTIAQLSDLGDKLEPRDFAVAALVASGATGEQIPAYLQQLDELYEGFLTYRQTKNVSLNDAESGILYLYEAILEEYVSGQTRLDVLLDNGTYNCVSSAILYMYMMKRKGFKVIANETPTHAFCTVLDNGKAIDVETTTPFGYKPGQNITVKNQSAGKKYNTHLTPGDYENRQRVSGRRLIALVYNNKIVELGDTPDENLVLQWSVDAAELQLNSRDGLQDLFFNVGNIMYRYCNAGEYAKALYVAKAITEEYSRFGKSQIVMGNSNFAFRKLYVKHQSDLNYLEKLIDTYGVCLSQDDYNYYYETFIYNKAVDLYNCGEVRAARELVLKAIDVLGMSKSLEDLKKQMSE